MLTYDTYKLLSVNSIASTIGMREKKNVRYINHRDSFLLHMYIVLIKNLRLI